MTSSADPASRLLRLAAVPLMLAAGAALAGQSQINGRLAHEIGSGPQAGIAAALISFGSGLALLVAGTLAIRRQRAGFGRFVEAVSARRLRPTELIGGVFGAFLVATQGLTVATIGVALFSVAVTAGQSCSALVVDHHGVGPSGHQPLSTPRLVAAVFAVAAVALATGERLIEQFDTRTVWFALLPLLAGAGIAVQQGLNGRVSGQVGPWMTTLNNFTVGTAALAVAFVASLLADGHLDQLPSTWWLYAGGAMGVVFIWLAAVLVRVHGVLVLGLSIVAGQVIGAEIIEITGGDAQVGPVGIAAGALTVVGVLVALLVRPRQGVGGSATRIRS